MSSQYFRALGSGRLFEGLLRRNILLTVIFRSSKAPPDWTMIRVLGSRPWLEYDVLHCVSFLCVTFD